ncbi:hypothetical protein HK101_006040, partial [Irineochytrium annulatum]
MAILTSLNPSRLSFQSRRSLDAPPPESHSDSDDDPNLEDPPHPGSDPFRDDDDDELDADDQAYLNSLTLHFDNPSSSSSSSEPPAPGTPGASQPPGPKRKTGPWRHVLRSLRSLATYLRPAPPSPTADDEDGRISFDWLTLQTKAQRIDDDAPEFHAIVHSPRAGEDEATRHARARRRMGVVYGRFVSETVVGLLVSLVGLVLAGVVLDGVQGWDVFTKVSELFILVPTLLNLKGNLEMNFAARLSVASHTDSLSTELVMGNLALIQVQALVCSVASGLWTFLIGWFRNLEPDLYTAERDTSLVVAVSVISGTLSCLISGVTITAVVYVCRRYKLDPDNLATPIAASFGDLTAVLLLASTSYLTGLVIDTRYPLYLSLLSILIPLPIALFYTLTNPHVRHHLPQGWPALLFSMMISTGAGLALETSMGAVKGVALMAPVT